MVVGVEGGRGGSGTGVEVSGGPEPLTLRGLACIIVGDVSKLPCLRMSTAGWRQCEDKKKFQSKRVDEVKMVLINRQTGLIHHR